MVLVDLTKEELLCDTPFLGIVSEVTKTVSDLSCDLNHSLSRVELALEDLREDLVDVIGVSVLDGDLKGSLVVLVL